MNEGYEINFKVTIQWNNGFNGNVTITNTSDAVIDNWAIGFDMPSKNSFITMHIESTVGIVP